MLVEIRRYQIKPGLRDTFVEWFEAEVVPEMQASGMRILGVFTTVEDPDGFVYLRAFTDADERLAQCESFYGGPAWESLKEPALAMEESYDVVLVESTMSSLI